MVIYNLPLSSEAKQSLPMYLMYYIELDLVNIHPRGGWTATRKASWEICMRFADWRHSRVDLSEVN